VVEVASLNNPGLRVRFQAGTDISSLCHCAETGSGAPHSRVFSLGVKMAKRKASSAQVISEWSYTSTPLMAWHSSTETILPYHCGWSDIIK